MYINKKQKEILTYISRSMLGECSFQDFYKHFFSDKQKSLSLKEKQRIDKMIKEVTELSDDEENTLFDEIRQDALKRPTPTRKSTPHLEYDVQLGFLLDEKLIEVIYKGDVTYYRLTSVGYRQLSVFQSVGSIFKNFIAPLLSIMAITISLLGAFELI